MIRQIWALIKKYCWGLGGLLTLCMFTKSWGFVPEVPSLVIWGLLAYIAFENFKEMEYSKAGILFICLIPLGILAFNPDPCFKSWYRYVNFVLLFIAIGPCLTGNHSNEIRIQAISTFTLLSMATGFISFFCYFLGINYMHMMDAQKLMRETGGYFGGLCVHSMTLAPIAAIGVTGSMYMYMLHKKKIYLFILICCLGATLFAASRSALVASFAGILAVTYYISEQHTKTATRLIRMGVIAIITFPIWGSATDLVMSKQKENEALGSVTASRDNKYNYRIQEFKESPFFGVGICAIDTKTGDEYDAMNGQIEPGTSWMQVPSMTGLAGTIPFIIIIIGAWKNSRNKREFQQKGLLLGILATFYLHFFAEGYLFSAGNEMCYFAWLVIATCSMPWDQYVNEDGKLFIVDEEFKES